MDIKVWLWEMTADKTQDNIKHQTLDSKVDMISVPIEDNNLSLDEEPHPQILDTLKTRLEFQGSIRLSKSGNSYNLFKDKLTTESDLITINIS